MASNCTPPGTQARLRSSFQTLGSRPAHGSCRCSGQAPTSQRATSAHGPGWVRLFKTLFSLSAEHLRQRFPQGTGSLLSLLARAPSGVLAGLALRLASDCLGQPSGRSSLRAKNRWLGPPPSTRVLLLFLRLLSLASCQGV